MVQNKTLKGCYHENQPKNKTLKGCYHENQPKNIMNFSLYIAFVFSSKVALKRNDEDEKKSVSIWHNLQNFGFVLIGEKGTFEFQECVCQQERWCLQSTHTFLKLLKTNMKIRCLVGGRIGCTTKRPLGPSKVCNNFEDLP